MFAVRVANVIYQTQGVGETTSYTLLGKIAERWVIQQPGGFETHMHIVTV